MVLCLTFNTLSLSVSFPNLIQWNRSHFNLFYGQWTATFLWFSLLNSRFCDFATNWCVDCKIIPFGKMIIANEKISAKNYTKISLSTQHFTYKLTITWMTMCVYDVCACLNDDDIVNNSRCNRNNEQNWFNLMSNFNSETVSGRQNG